MKTRPPRVKRTLTLPEEIDCKIRTLAATKRIAVSYMIEGIINDFFNLDLNVTQKNE